MQLQNAVESLLAQDLPPQEFEIILVDDGSSDKTPDYLRTLQKHKNVRWIQIEHSGISVARNAGAAIARGQILAFTDDDCVVPRNWLGQIEDALRSNRAAAVGGVIRNQKKGNRLAIAYTEMNEMLRAHANRHGESPRFLTTDNLACWNSTFGRFGGFDERFFNGAEDREFLARLVASGEKVTFVPEIVIDHYHSFRLSSFLFHMYEHGRGSYLLHKVIGIEKGLPVEKTSVRVIFQMMRATMSRHSIFDGLTISLLILLAQVFAALGYMSAAWEGVTNLRKEGAERGTRSTSGE